MDIEQLKAFFHLPNLDQLIRTEIRPHSCGGSDIFDQRALLGDKILGLHLIEYLIKEGVTNRGNITKAAALFHNYPMLAKICKKLGLPAFLNPLNNIPLQDKELGELIEALIGATYLQTGLEFTPSIVDNLLDYYDEKDGAPRNYKNEVFEMYDAVPEQRPEIAATGIYDENQPPFQIDKEFRFRGTSFKITTETHQKKIGAEQDAARLLLIKIKERFPDGIFASYSVPRRA